MNLRVLSGLLAGLVISGCASNKRPQERRTSKPNRIILMIGDGMGLTQISTLYLDNNSSVFNQFDCIGLMDTKPTSHKITDSGASATAMACGQTSYNNSIGVDKDSVPMENLIEYVSKRQYATGIISSSSVTHATPAAFYSHVKHRSLQYDIAKQLLASDVDFFAGGGLKYLRPLQDDMKLYNWVIDSSGAYTKSNAAHAQAKKLGIVAAEDGLQPTRQRPVPFMQAMMQVGWERLEQDKRSFLLVEGSQIDWGGHDKNYTYVVSELLEFQELVELALQKAKLDKHTLVVVTGDHATGGLTLNPKTYTDTKGNIKSDYGKVEHNFSTDGHNADLIPVFAYGPGANLFQGVYTNADIAKRLKQLIK